VWYPQGLDDFGIFALVRTTALVRSCPDSQSNKQRKNEVKNIFVGNLNFGATEDSVRSLFEAYGPVERVNLVTDRDTGRAKGFGFVEMSANADADRAIAGLNGTDLDGRALNVSEARPKPERGFGGGGQRRNNRW
jgi:RNA recognition motif-containing protein